jgi:hypothetical protein
MLLLGIDHLGHHPSGKPSKNKIFVVCSILLIIDEVASIAQLDMFETKKTEIFVQASGK